MPSIEPRPWTVADIGGTHARLARWLPATGLTDIVRVRNDDFADATALLNHWFAVQRDAPRQVLLALAMPVGAGAATLTNRAWRFEPPALAAALQLQRLVLVNDFAAAAAGIDSLPASAMQALDSTRPMQSRLRLVLGAGTGLGVAAVVDDTPPRVLASEAGHMTFGGADPLAERLLADGRRRWGRVSWERVLCGEGLAWLDALIGSRAAPETPPNVARRAQQGDATAVAAARAFSRLLGEFAGDACLAFQASAVFLAGGVLHGLGNCFDAPGFLAAFADKGRYAALMGRVPCYLVTGHELGLEGAARYLAGECRMPVSEWVP